MSGMFCGGAHLHTWLKQICFIFCDTLLLCFYPLDMVLCFTAGSSDSSMAITV